MYSQVNNDNPLLKHDGEYKSLSLAEANLLTDGTEMEHTLD